MSRARSLAISAVLALGLSVCAPAGFKSEALVDTVRVLAVQAELPFAEPGEDVNLRALVVDPKGRALRFAFATCTNPGSAEIPACAAALGPFQTEPVPPDGEPTFSIHVPEDALAGGLPIGSVGIVFAACAGTLSIAARPEGAPIGCVDGSGNAVGRDGFVWGEKRVTVVRGARNANPDVKTVAIDGHRWDEGFDVALDQCGGSRVEDCPAPAQHQLDVLVPDGTAEQYLDRTEDVVTFFYMSAGAVRDEVVRSSVNDFATMYAPAGADPARPIDVWVVVRDDRGGVGWAHRTAVLR